MIPRIPASAWTAARALALAGVLAVQGCALFTASAPRYGPRHLVFYATQILRVEEPSPEFYRERSRLEAMGPELDGVLFGLVEDGSVDEVVRANALVLLADRRTAGALDLARRHLLSNPVEAVRIAAVEAVQRYVAEVPEARTALRAAISDPTPRVRLTVLQRLGVEDAALVRAALAVEDDRQVRLIARQLLALLEERGAPLTADDRGQLRTRGLETAPQLVFQPAGGDPGRGSVVGALWVEMPGSTLVPLSQEVEVVEGVVPAFFDSGRRAVVYEAERAIWVRDLASGETRRVTAGVAPRLVPFTDQFVFLREAPDGRIGSDDGMVIEYHVLRGSFNDAGVEALGELRALVRPDRHGGASPVRWMVVGEAGDHFVLRAPGMTTFVLP